MHLNLAYLRLTSLQVNRRSPEFSAFKDTHNSIDVQPHDPRYSTSHWLANTGNYHTHAYTATLNTRGEEINT